MTSLLWEQRAAAVWFCYQVTKHLLEEIDVDGECTMIFTIFYNDDDLSQLNQVVTLN